ncbi:MAG: SDR family oxidoreductase [Pirellulaceae bacterium]|nr:SDR family oxidoreductase [Pirellulaceae bacterium]
MSPQTRRVLVTGGAGYLGREVASRLLQQRELFSHVVCADIRCPSQPQRLEAASYRQIDVRDVELANLLRQEQVDTVVHLASIVHPGGPKQRPFEYSVDVLGTRNVIEACLRANVKQLVVTSSGAAYGYYADNPMPLTEDCPLRGNPSFAYADHKRQVEELLAKYRRSDSQLRQLIFRPGTILGQFTHNAITRLFDRRRLLSIKGSDVPFVLIWDQDVAQCIALGIQRWATGIFNLAADGVLTMRQMAAIQNKALIELSPRTLGAILWSLRALGLTHFGPEQVDFLRYRPVLSNEKLKREFGYVPQMTTEQVFRYYLQCRSNHS